MAALLAAGIGAVGSIAGGLFGGSDDGSKLQKRAVKFSQPVPTRINIPGIGEINVSGGRDDLTIQQSGGDQFKDLSSLLGGLAFDSANRSPLFNINDTGFGINNLGAGANQVSSAFSNLQSSIQGLQSFDQDAFAAQQFDRLQSLASRGEEIAANRVGSSLFARGRLGGDDTASGAAFEGLARAQEDARTSRALQAFGLADQAFQQQRGIVQDNLSVLQQAQVQQQLGLQGFTGLQGLLSADQQQNIQNALGLSVGAGQVLDPVFRGVETAIQARLGDQANRVSAATGAAGAASGIIAQSNAARTNAIGNAFGGIVDAVGNSDISIFGRGGD